MSDAFVRAYAGTGMLGSGFVPASLETALSWKPDFIACDGGSTDGGPSYLATGRSMFGAESTKRDLKALLAASRQAKIPLVIGSAGTGGGDRNLAWLRDLLLQAARELGVSFRLACISSQQTPDAVVAAWQAGRVTPLQPAPNIDEAAIRECDAIVGMMGTEPITAALEQGADVVLCGRASDAALFAAIPLLRGVSPGIAWHAAKVLECGAAAVTHRTTPDGMFATLERDAFTIAPPNPSYRCTPLSVAAHSLYENADPFKLREPPGVVDLTTSSYEAVDERTVRVTGTNFEPASRSTIKLEGAALTGYRSMVLGGIRDPFILRQLDDWLARVREAAATRIAASFPGMPYELVIRTYGRDGVMGAREPHREPAHEVLVAFEVTAADQESAHAMADDLRHIALHFPIPEWHGLITVLAHAHSPAVIDLGPSYRFVFHHVMTVDDLLEPFTLNFEMVNS